MRGAMVGLAVGDNLLVRRDSQFLEHLSQSIVCLQAQVPRPNLSNVLCAAQNPL